MEYSGDFEPFGVDLQHFMEDIKEHYSFPIEEAAIVENVDNCIDEKYDKIYFDFDDDILRIWMSGDGICEDIFWNTLPKLAASTKIDEGKKSGLGRFGWGMKVAMWISDSVIIETKFNGFRAAQEWKIVNGIPSWRKISPKTNYKGNYTLVKMKLKEEYRDKITYDFINRVLKRFYPTIVNGAPVKNRYGIKRKLKIFVNAKPIPSIPEIDYEKKKVLRCKIDNETVCGYVYLTKDKLPEEERGISIIVCGRKITREFFGVFGNKNDRITGYLHADVLVENLKGDKTILSRTGNWKPVSKEIAQQLSNFMKEIGAIREEKVPQKMISKVHKEINDLIKYFPELQSLAIKSLRKRKVLLPNENGDVPSSISIEGSQITKGDKPGPGDGSGIAVPPGEKQKEVTVKDECGEKKSVKRERKIRAGITILLRPYPSQKRESWYSEDGSIIVNTSFPSYKKADKMKSRDYHVIRCAIEALLDYAYESGTIERKEYKDYWNEVFSKWGEIK